MKDKRIVEVNFEITGDNALMEVQGGASEGTIGIIATIRNTIIEWLGIK